MLFIPYKKMTRASIPYISCSVTMHIVVILAGATAVVLLKILLIQSTQLLVKDTKNRWGFFIISIY
jgi:hypothetical protein